MSTINRCANCDVDPHFVSYPGERANDRWAVVSVGCRKCGYTVIEHMSPVLVRERGLAELEQSVIETWNGKHKPRWGRAEKGLVPF